jgi:hypothetical protein
MEVDDVNDDESVRFSSESDEEDSDVGCFLSTPEVAKVSRNWHLPDAKSVAGNEEVTCATAAESPVNEKRPSEDFERSTVGLVSEEAMEVSDAGDGEIATFSTDAEVEEDEVMFWCRVF